MFQEVETLVFNYHPAQACTELVEVMRDPVSRDQSFPTPIGNPVSLFLSLSLKPLDTRQMHSGMTSGGDTGVCIVFSFNPAFRSSHYYYQLRSSFTVIPAKAGIHDMHPGSLPVLLLKEVDSVSSTE